MLKRLSTVVIVCLGTLGLTFGTAATASADPVPPYCTTTVDNPHVSTGAGGIIVKSRTVCANGMAEVRIGLTLWHCPRKPTGDKGTWAAQGCAIVKAGSRVVKPPTNGTTYTTYAPPNGQVGAHGSGWWAGTAVTTGYNSASVNIFRDTTLGNAVSLTG